MACSKPQTTASTDIHGYGRFSPTNQYKRLLGAWFPREGTDPVASMIQLDTLRARLNPSFMICQWETCPTTKKLHLQWYAEWPRKVYGNKILKTIRASPMFPEGTSVKLMVPRGTSKQNQDYCSKEETRVEGTETYVFGEPAEFAGGSIRTLMEAAREGASELDLIQSDPEAWSRYHKTITQYKALIQPKRNWPTKLIFFWGPTSMGKTAQAQHFSPETVHYRDPFVQGYTSSSETILFDDFDWKRMPPKFWLTLCDRYPMTVEVKGGLRNFAPKMIIFTSNDDPKTWWPEAPEETRAAIHRRMEEFGEIHFLGHKVPHDQKLLTGYFESKTAAPSVDAPSADPPIISDTEEYEDHSQPSDFEMERRLKRARPTVVDLTQE